MPPPTLNAGGGGGVQENLLYFLRALGVVRLHRVPIREIKRADIYRYSFDLIFLRRFFDGCLCSQFRFVQIDGND